VPGLAIAGPTEATATILWLRGRYDDYRSYDLDVMARRRSVEPTCGPM
jgi:hypothetical protein